MPTQHNLDRFLNAQKDTYHQALLEIKNGRKTGHWMWFVFPQLEGLGRSETARFYAIKNRDEAAAYLKHPVLGKRLIEISDELLLLPSNDAGKIFGGVDGMKLRSSMTLFASLNPTDQVFEKVLDKFFGGVQDGQTTRLFY